MEKRFDKALLLCPGKYSLTNSLYDILAELSGEVIVHDPGSDLSAGELKIIAAILEWPVIEKILTHLGLDPQPPPRGRAREIGQH